jgi:hypothetical protein
VIEQLRLGETAAVKVAYEPALIGDVTWTSRTRADADAGTASATAMAKETEIRLTDGAKTNARIGFVKAANWTSFELCGRLGR